MNKTYFKRPLILMLVLLLTGNLIACGNTSNTSPVETVAEALSESSSEASSELSTESTDSNDSDDSIESTESTESMISYPITITDHLKREVTIAEQPKTLVSGYYITSSLLIALGLEDQLAGIEAKAASRNIYSLSAPKLLELPNVGTAKEFDLEGCMALHPDLIIVPTKLKDSIPMLEELGATVIAVNPENQDLLFETIDMIATATNTTEKGEALKDFITDSLNGLYTTLEGADSPRVYLSGNSSLLDTAGAAMYQNTLIENAQGTNVASELSDDYWATISYEQLLDWNPDYIILAADASYDVNSVLKDKNLADCNAVSKKQVYQIPNGIESWDSPVPGSFLGSVYLASVLHPELVSDEDFQTLTQDFYHTFYDITLAKTE